MAAINDLIAQITDEGLRKRIEQEVNKLSKQKKFGLVFESHLPEVTPFYDMPIKAGCKVILRDRREDKNIYIVLTVDNGMAVCGLKSAEETKSISVNDLVRVAEFGESIYPYLKPIDCVCNSSEDDFWHALIEADNYHALQLLEYLYASRVDCIYILIRLITIETKAGNTIMTMLILLIRMLIANGFHLWKKDYELQKNC